MKKRTIADIDEDIDNIELEILEIKKTISEDGPDWREAWRRKTGDIGPGYIPLAERRKRVELLESKIARLKGERQQLAAKQSQSSSKTFHYGELKQKIEDLAKRDGCKADGTVPSTKVSKWRKEIEAEGYKITDGAIRAKLSALGFSKEKRKKK